MSFCESKKKNGDPCIKDAVAYLHTPAGPAPACAWHTGRAGVDNVLTLNEVKNVLLSNTADGHAQRIMRDAHHLEAGERAKIATEILLADLLANQVPA